MNKSYTLVVFVVLTILLNSCLGSYESQDRDALISSFEDNFGFKPPASVKEIKLKNYGIYDTTVHWMAFTYDDDVIERIIQHDQPLEIANVRSQKFFEITDEIKKSVNNPEWLALPDLNTKEIYYKLDFLNHTFSEYYLWTNTETGMVYLYVHYFD